MVFSHYETGVLAGHPLRWSPRLTTLIVISSLKSHLREHLNDLNMLLSFVLLICNLIALRSENVFWVMAILKTWWQNKTKQNPLLMINQPSFRSTWNNACVFWGVLSAGHCCEQLGLDQAGAYWEGCRILPDLSVQGLKAGATASRQWSYRGVLASCTSGLLRVECWVGSCWHPTSSASEKPGGRGAGQAWGDSH